jgi:type IV pilus assembly protein PilM
MSIENPQSQAEKTSSPGMLHRFLPAVFDPDSVIAVDVGLRDIKAVEFKKRSADNQWLLENLQLLPLSADASTEEKDTERIQALRAFFARKDLKKTKVICVLSDVNSVAMKLVTPLISAAELKEALFFKIKDFIHLPAEEVSIDFKIMARPKVEQDNKEEILAVAFPKETINYYLSLFKEAKVIPSAFISLPTCIEHNLEIDDRQPQTIAFVDLGATHTELVIMQNSKFAFGRKIPVNSDGITRALGTVLESSSGKVALSFDEAEKMKREYGLPKAGNEPISGKSITSSQVLSLIRPEIEKLASEIERSFDYYREEFRASKIDRLVLIGAGANLKGLVDFLSQELSLPVGTGEPLVHSSAITAEQKVTFFTCIGAALSALAQSVSAHKEINLLPVEIREQGKILMRRLALEAILSALVVVCLLLFIGLKVATLGIRKRLEAVRVQVYTLSYQRELGQLRDSIEQIYTREPNWNEVFRELSNLVPDNAYLEHLSYVNDELVLEGVIISKTDTTESVASDFLVALEKGIFKNASFIESKRKKEGSRFISMEFKLKCRIR